LIRLEKVSVNSGAFQLAGIDMEIPTGQYAVLMGRTGSGKTTLLEAICGLRHVLGGSIYLMNKNVTTTKPAGRGIGYVPQDSALFGTMTVREHLGFAPSIRGWNRGDLSKRIAELSELLGITHLLDRKPHGLSGGEARRVSLGRALASQPQILCLDEPLSALDDETRVEMQQLLRSVRERSDVTILHVTHQSSEAQCLADRVLTLRQGRIETSA
jgi:molybdate/tungstate transport system ATP-binding protein